MLLSPDPLSWPLNVTTDLKAYVGLKQEILSSQPNEFYAGKLLIPKKYIPGILKFSCSTRCHQHHLQYAEKSH